MNREVSRRKKSLFSSLGARITSTVSVALVLFILGVIALIGIVARNVTESIKENMGFDVLLTEGATEEDLKAVETLMSHSPFALSVTSHTPEEAAEKWKSETGEDVEELLGMNPFVAEVEVKVKSQWASSDSLRSIARELEELPGVGEISIQADMIDSINSNISTIAVALLVVAIALLFISFVLINNTVRLTVYAKRFIIHTMRLVGATGGFIRRPFIVSNIWQGLIAAVLSIGLLWGLWSYVSTFDPMLPDIITTGEMILIAASLLVTGVIICGLAATFAANRYLSLTYDEMFS